MQGEDSLSAQGVDDVLFFEYLHFFIDQVNLRKEHACSAVFAFILRNGVKIA